MRSRRRLVWGWTCIIGFLIVSPIRATDSLLIRSDKHFIGGGDRVIWAPEFPQFLERLGFWDHACFLDKKVEPIFTITLLDKSLNEIQPKLLSNVWQPSHVTRTFHQYKGIEITEQRTMLPTDVLASILKLNNTTKTSRLFHIIVWTCQQLNYTASMNHPDRRIKVNSVHAFRNRISWERNYNDQVTVGVTVGTNYFAKAKLMNASDGNRTFPYWNHTPFYEKITRAGLKDELHYNPYQHTSGLLYMGLYYQIEIPPDTTIEFISYAAIQPSEALAIETFDNIPKNNNPVQEAQHIWEQYYSEIPTFHCTDPYIEKYYYYRWYGLRLNSINTHGDFNLPFPCIFEGINSGWFRHQISYSAFAHIYETRWMHSPEIARGSLQNFIHHQKPDGSFYGAIMSGKTSSHVGFYHANWGRALRQLHRIHPNHDYLKDVYPALVKYATYFDRARDREGWHLYDVINQWETGQEFSSRYNFVDSKSDKGGALQLKGVDATTYMYELQQTLAWLASELGFQQDVKKWETAAAETKAAVRSKMWNPNLQMFVDVDPKTGKQSPIKAATCFYPFFTDIVSKKHISAITNHLLNPNEFWTKYPVPSLSLDDPMANAFGEWKDKRRVCPWNGRSWLMSTSHVCEALIETAQHLDASLKPKAAEMLKNFIHMLYIDDDINRPTSYEYYNSMNGRAPFFRGTDDYMHSWIVDLIIKYVAGLQPDDGNLIVVNPLPMGLTSFTLDNVIVKGFTIKIVWETTNADPAANGLFVYVDGIEKSHTTQLSRVEIKL